MARSYQEFKNNKPKLVAIWNGHRLAERAVIDAAKRFNLKIAYFENGFLPKTTLIDPAGVNIDCTLTRDPNFYREYLDKVGGLTQLTKVDDKLDVREANEKKLGYGSEDGNNIDINKPYIFVPFQVDIDSQVLLNSPRIQSMYALYDELKKLANDYPDWQFICKRASLLRN